MKRIVNSNEMKALDRNTIEHHGIPSVVLMERAALAVFEELQTFDLTSTLVVCGSGNNGGDGIAVARFLHLSGRKVAVCQLGNPDRMSDDCRKQTTIALSYGVSFVNNPIYSEYTTIVDAVFGVGLSRTVEGKYKDAIEKINASSAKVMAVDIPSGINADNGHVLGCAVQADVTVTFAYAKVGHCLYPGKACCGDIRVRDIGIYDYQYDKFENHRYMLEIDDLKIIPKRRSDGNKGTFGKVLVVAGSDGMAGAAVLCARAVMRCGAGMVKIITHESNRVIIQQIIPEAMIGTYKTSDEAIDELQRGLSWANVVVCGCGLGTGPISEAMVYYLLSNCTLPFVLDADGLNTISTHLEWLEQISTVCIITPHLGEMSRLTGLSIKEIKENLIQTALNVSGKYNVQCVLKDAVSCITTPDQKVYLNTSGNSGMATAGSGDVLAGVIAALLAVKTPEEYTGALGAYIHGLAGDMAKVTCGEAFLMAGDLIKELKNMRLGEE